MDDFDVFTIDAGGSSLRRITALGTAKFPCWSADGAKILFAGGAPPTLWWANSDGSELVDTGVAAIESDVCADGTVFFASVDENSVWRMREGEQPEKIVDVAPTWIRRPRCSPDGGTILCWLLHRRDGLDGVWTYAGGEWRFVAAGKGGTWSPTGQTAVIEQAGDLWIADVSSGAVSRLLGEGCIP